jgi:hypothetical protein
MFLSQRSVRRHFRLFLGDDLAGQDEGISLIREQVEGNLCFHCEIVVGLFTKFGSAASVLERAVAARQLDQARFRARTRRPRCTTATRRDGSRLKRCGPITNRQRKAGLSLVIGLRLPTDTRGTGVDQTFEGHGLLPPVQSRSALLSNSARNVDDDPSRLVLRRHSRASVALSRE